jgi:putative membrane protein insertion efficiency factor
MSSLRSLSRRPEPYLAAVAAFLVFLAVDSSRPPQAQVSADWYVGAVHAYQHFGRPVANRFIRCRYSPTCSEYSIQAVQKYGVARGLVMTVRRLASCRKSVKPGTLDPVVRLQISAGFG